MCLKNAPCGNPAPPQVQVRHLDYPVGYDYTIQPRAYEPVAFPQLQALADNYDLLRIAMEIRKRQIRRLPGQFRLRKSPGMTLREAQRRSADDQRIQFLAEFFRMPKTHAYLGR